MTTSRDDEIVSIEVGTAHGPARVQLQPAPPGALAALVLGHGAGGGVSAPDLHAAARAALAQGVAVALVEQPYRVAGRRSPAPQRQLDAAWLTVIDQLRAGALERLLVIVGGRSSGARVACRTADSAGAIGVLCLAFPLQPPQGRRATPAASRLSELELVRVPTLVVQGENDPFGRPPGGRNRKTALVPGDHSLRRSSAEVEAVVGPWLSTRVQDLTVAGRRHGRA